LRIRAAKESRIPGRPKRFAHAGQKRAANRDSSLAPGQRHKNFYRVKTLANKG